MKKLLLVNANPETNPYPVPPLGLCLVANSVKEIAHIEVLDATFMSPEMLRSRAREFSPDCIGLSIRNIDDMTYDKLNYYVDQIMMQTIQPLKDEHRVPLVLGGAGFSIFPDALIRQMGASYGVCGPGERVFPELLRKIFNSDSLPDVPLLIRDSMSATAMVQTGENPYSQSAAEIDQWIDYSPYRQRGAYPVQAKRGCGFHCVYCTYPGIEGNKLRPRTASEVVDEMEGAAGRLGDITFEFVDSVFNDPPGHAEAICREILSRGLTFRMRTMGINPRHTTAELLELMMNAGFRQIDCTPDSASESMLRSLGKNFILSDLKRTATLIREAGLPSMWFFLLGGPGESEETIGETFSFIDDMISPEDLVHLSSGLRIYPGTPLQQIALKEGLISKEEDLLKPLFYFSPQTPHDRLVKILQSECVGRPNCLLSSDSTPPPEMMAKAVEMRRVQRLDEPMFRTLLRLKRDLLH